VPDRGRAVFGPQLGEDGREQPCQPVAQADRAAEADPQLVAQPAQGHAVSVVPPDEVRGQFVAEERLGEHGGPGGLHGPATAGAVAAMQTVEDGRRLGRGDVQHGAGADAMVLQRPATDRAVRGHRAIDHPRGGRRGKGGPAVARVARAGAAPLALALGRTIGFERAPGRGGGRSEEALGGLALTVPELPLQALVLFEELVDAPLLRQATLADGAPHGAWEAAPPTDAGAVRKRAGTSRPSG
jgi:hypothetical protein